MAESLGAIDVWRKKWGIPLAILAAAVVWLLPVPADLKPQGHLALVVFAGVFVLYLTEAMSLSVTSLAIVPLVTLTGLVKPAAALAPFGSSSVYLLVAAFILAAAMVKTKLAARITYLIMSMIGSGTANLIIGVVLANIVLAFLVPSSTARTAILLPVCVSIIELFGEKGRSKFAVNLLLTLAFTNATISAGILTATVPNPVTVDFIVKAGGPKIEYMQWFLYGFPPALLMTFFTWWFIQILYKPEKKEIPGGSAHVAEQLRAMGPMASAEKRTLATFALVVVLWLTGPLTGIDTTIAAMAGAVLLFLPRFGVLSWGEAERGISWQIVMITGGGMSMGGVLMQTGAASWIANQIFHMFGLGSLGVLGLLIAVLVIVQYLHLFFVGTTVMVTAMMPIVLALGKTAGVPPVVLAMPVGMVIGAYPLLMFYNTIPNIMVYGTERMRVSDFPKVGVVACGVACLLYAVCGATYWKWLGLY